MVKQLRYQWVTVVNKQNCFLQYKKEKIMQARKMANLTYSIIACSCSKILIGKTYWKSVVLPGVLYGASVLTWTRKEIIAALNREPGVETGVGRTLIYSVGCAAG